MILRVEPSVASFDRKLRLLEQAIQNKQLITDSLTVMSKYSIRYVVLKVCAPFYYLFNKDPFAHLRIERVFFSLYNYLEKNNSHLKTNHISLLYLKENVVYPLCERVNKANKKIIASYESKISRLIKPTFSNTIWPEDISSIGIDYKEKKEIDSLLLNARKLDHSSVSLSKENGKRTLYLKSKNKIVQFTKTSNSLFFLDIDGVRHAILSLKKDVGSGAQRKKIRLCWDLTEGKKLVKKPLVSGYEGMVIKHLLDLEIQNISSIRGVVKKANSIGKAIEEFYPYTLSSLIKKPNLLSFKNKLGVTKQLIDFLFKMHAQECKLIIPFNRNLPSVERTIPFHHKDIKPSNILLKGLKKNSQLEAVFSDFGSSCQPFSLSYSLPYRPPEALIFLQELTSYEKAFNFNSKFGQAGDIWSFGLTLLDLFYPNGYKTPTELLPSLKNFQLNYEHGSPPLDQNVLDQELAHIYNEIVLNLSSDQKNQFDCLWDRIIKPSLLINTENRANASFLLNSAKALTEME